VINRDRFSAINIKAELSYISYFIVPGGQETSSEKIDLVKAELFSLDKFDPSSEYATYSYRFKIKKHEDLRTGLKDNTRKYIRLKILATHSISNIGKVFEKKYRADQIINGDFVFGESLEIINE
jgi:hypothetical protein